MNFLYFHVVSGDAFFFFICLGAKVSVPGGRKLPAATGLEGKLWFGALLEYFLREFEYHQLTCLAGAEAWGWPELCRT